NPPPGGGGGEGGFFPPRRGTGPTSAWLRFRSLRLNQPSSTSSICFATIAGSSTYSVVNSSWVKS
ncbi:hypothetical protein KCA24_25225, partial [Escherichia coli]|nr:hypothetical protein [Escherichia coli]